MPAINPTALLSPNSRWPSLLHFFRAQTRQILAAFGIHIARSVVVPLQRRVLQAEAALFHLGLQVLARVLEVEVAQHDFIRTHFAGTLDALDPSRMARFSSLSGMNGNTA